jgi:hypothetical protein
MLTINHPWPALRNMLARHSCDNIKTRACTRPPATNAGQKASLLRLCTWCCNITRASAYSPVGGHLTRAVKLSVGAVGVLRKSTKLVSDVDVVGACFGSHVRYDRGGLGWSRGHRWVNGAGRARLRHRTVRTRSPVGQRNTPTSHTETQVAFAKRARRWRLLSGRVDVCVPRCASRCRNAGKRNRIGLWGWDSTKESGESAQRFASVRQGHGTCMCPPHPPKTSLTFIMFFLLVQCRPFHATHRPIHPSTWLLTTALAHTQRTNHFPCNINRPGMQSC